MQLGGGQPVGIRSYREAGIKQSNYENKTQSPPEDTEPEPCEHSGVNREIKNERL